MTGSNICHNPCALQQRLHNGLHCWRLLAFALLLCAVSATSFAVDGTRGASQYLRQRWGKAQGLPGVVHAIAQTPDGYLWIGTDVALLRFDGTTFTVAQSTDPNILPMRNILALTVDPQGTLWIWMQGTRVVLYQNGIFKKIGHTLPNADTVITAVSQTRSGNLIVSSLGRAVTSTVGEVSTQLSASPGPLLISIAQTSDGKVWLGTREGGLYYLSEKHPFPVAGHLPDQKINCLLAGGNGRLWIGTDGGLALWDGSHLVTEPFPAPLDHAQILSLVEDRDGNLWAGTGDGLVRYNGRTADAFKDHSPVTALFEDRDGNLWAGNTQGIERLSAPVFTTWSRTEGLPTDAFGPVFVDAMQRTWFAPLHGGLYWMRNGQVHRVTAAGLDSDVVYSIDGDRDDIWLGRQRGGLTRLHLQGDNIVPETFRLTSGDIPPVVYAVHANRDSSVWLGTLTEGALHLVNGVATAFAANAGLASDSVSAIQETSDGAMWFGTPDNGISVFANKHWRSYSITAGLPSSDVTCLFADRQGTLWIGTNSGLAYVVKGVIKSAAQTNTFLHERILGISEDSSGKLWLSTSAHIFSADRDSILKSKPLLRDYTAADGLRSTNGVRRSRSVVADPAGRIWISTSNGLSVIDPATSASQASAAIAHIVSLFIDGKPIDEGAEPEVPAAGQRVAFNYTGFNFAAPEKVLFRYRLDGFDHDWSEPVHDRLAVYTNLSPGSYRFRVMASNNGIWSTPVASTGLRIAPRFWQTWWFTLLCLLFAIFVCILLYQLRLQQMIRSANGRFEERLAERTRIAQELHDTLLQGFFSASMQLHVVTSSVPADSPARPQLDRIVTLIGRVLDEGRNAVRGLRSEDQQSLWLEEALGVMLRDLGNQEDVRHSIVVDGVSRLLRPGVQDEICRVVREALGNAFYHARANLIEVELRYSSPSITIEVLDDGVGIDPQTLEHGRQGHWGLPGMRERAASIGAKLRISNRTTGGASVILTVPGHIAYRRYSRNVALNWLAQRFRSPSDRQNATRTKPQ